MKDEIFIVGSGRSGTTLIRDILNKSPDIFVLPESGYYDRLWAARRYLGGINNRDNRIKWIYYLLFHSHDPAMHKFRSYFPILCEMSDAFNKNISISEFLREILVLLGRKYKNARIYGEKTPREAFYLNHMSRDRKRAVFVLIYRDPRAVIHSMLNRKELKHTVKSAIAEWCLSVGTMLNYAKLNPQNSVEIRYEDLVKNPKVEMMKILDLFRLKWDNEYMCVNSNSSFNTLQIGIQTVANDRWKNEMAIDDIKLIEEYCSPYMKILGYRLLNKVVKKNVILNHYYIKLKAETVIGHLGFRPLSSWSKRKK